MPHYINCIRILILIILFISGIKAQQNQPDSFSKKISVNFNQVEFEVAIKLLQEKTDFSFSYNVNNIPIKTIIDKKFENISFSEILNYLLEKTNCTYSMPVLHQIVIKPNLKKGKFTGLVIDAKNGNPLIGVNVIALNKFIGDATDNDGKFTFDKLNPGIYDFKFDYMGYKSETIKNIVIKPGKSQSVKIELSEQALQLDQIVVTPGSFSVMGNKSITMQSLTKEDIEDLSFGEDIYRAVTRIPGVSANDFSAKFTVRGGEDNEVLVLLDGMELMDPFHMKDLMGGALSIVDATIIQNADILTGGFTSEFGNKMSGVFNISSIQPSENNKSLSASISMMNARIMTKGTFDDNNGSYFVSLRRGYLDLVLNLLEEKSIPKPVYYDLYGKTEYKLHKNHSLSLNFLHSGDKFTQVEDDLDETNSNYHNNYIWLNLKSILSRNLFIQTVISYTDLYQHRRGLGYFGDGTDLDKNFEVDDNRTISKTGLKFDLNYKATEGFDLKLGANYSFGKSDYKYKSDYFITKFSEDYGRKRFRYINEKSISPETFFFDSYLSGKFKITPNFVSEIGIRYDFNSATEEHLLSPRVSLAFILGKKTFLRSSWGIFNQSQNIDELRIKYGEDQFYDSQKAEHYVLGFEHEFDNGFNFRIEGYYKKMTDLLDGYKNIESTTIMFPEVHDDLVSFNYDYAEAKGIETYLKYDNGGIFSFWTSYSLTYAEEFVKSSTSVNQNEYNVGKSFPRSNDQRHTFYFDVNYRPNKLWHFNLAFQYRSGSPFSMPQLVKTTIQNRTVADLSFNDYNESRLPDYTRADIKVTRNFFTDYGKFRVFLEIINFTGCKNLRDYDFNIEYSENNVWLEKEGRKWFPLMPSFGVSWEMEL